MDEVNRTIDAAMVIFSVGFLVPLGVLVIALDDGGELAVRWRRWRGFTQANQMGPGMGHRMGAGIVLLGAAAAAGRTLELVGSLSLPGIRLRRGHGRPVLPLCGGSLSGDLSRQVDAATPPSAPC